MLDSGKDGVLMAKAASRKGKPQHDVVSAAKQVSHWITSARYPLHSRLPAERELAVMLRLPRAKVREALQVLEDDGRIWRRVGMGTFVGGRPRLIGSPAESLAAVTSLTDILEARSAIEPVVARLSAQRAGQVDVTMIEHYAATADKARSWAEWERWDDLLHRAIAEASGNGLLISMVDQLLRIKTHPRWTIERAAKFDPALALRYGREHQAVISRVIGQDGKGAEAAMRRHMLSLSLTIGPAVSRMPSRVQWE